MSHFARDLISVRFPQTAELGLESKYDYTPRVYRRIVFASAQAASFEDAAEALDELGELKLLSKRVWRAAKRIGEERVEECRIAAQQYEKLPLPARRQSPVPQVPSVACVQMDGGRFQERQRTALPDSRSDSTASQSGEPTADSGNEGLWKEYKAGVLLSMTSERHAEDPWPAASGDLR